MLLMDVTWVPPSLPSFSPLPDPADLSRASTGMGTGTVAVATSLLALPRRSALPSFFRAASAGGMISMSMSWSTSSDDSDSCSRRVSMLWSGGHGDVFVPPSLPSPGASMGVGARYKGR